MVLRDECADADAIRAARDSLYAGNGSGCKSLCTERRELFDKAVEIEQAEEGCHLDYVQGKEGEQCEDAGLREILDQTKCERAHIALNLTQDEKWLSSEHDPRADIPCGCSTRQHDLGQNHRLHFNDKTTALECKGRTDLTPVCVRP